MDTFEPEFPVTSIEPVGDLIDFVTEIGGYHMFFKYNIAEVIRLKPETANTYLCLGDPKIIYDSQGNPTHHSVPVQFYQCDIDTSSRIMRKKDLEKNFDLMMKLLNK